MMKQLYQILIPLLKTFPPINHELMMLKCPEFLTEIALDNSPATSENQLCYMDYYQLQQINLLKQIGIKVQLKSSFNKQILKH